MTLPVPEQLLPVPRLIIWHGDIEQPVEQRALGILQRAYHASIAHGMFETGKTAGGNDWSGWHFPDAEAIAGLATVARVIAPDHWTILEEPG